MSEDKEAAASPKRQLDEVKEHHRLNAPYERALGRLSIRFSLLHALLEQFSWKIWGLNERVGTILTKDLPTKHLVKKIRDSAELLAKDEIRKKLLALLNRVEKVADKRNEFLHSIWIIRKGQPTFFLSRKRGRLVGPQAPSVEDINAFSRDIMMLVADCMELEDGKTLLRRISDVMDRGLNTTP